VDFLEVLNKLTIKVFVI